MTFKPISIRALLACFASLICGPSAALAQISPAEILNPKLKALEQAYLKQLVSANQTIAKTQFPYTFFLSRYAGLDPKDQAGADRRGLEFVKFHDSLVLKTTGNYNAAFSGELLTSNQRASRVFDDVIVPILSQLAEGFAPAEGFDAFGFEISYHVLRKTKDYQYEGREILVVVLNKDDAINYRSLQGAKRQELLNRSEIYLDGKPLGLMLGERDPLPVEALERTNKARASGGDEGKSKSFSVASPITVEPSGAVTADPDLLARMRDYRPPLNIGAVTTDGSPRPGGIARPETKAGPPLTKADTDRIQSKYQPQLDAMVKQAKEYHLVDYAPPSFVIFRNQLFLQLTLRNRAGFDKEATSIYKRAAQNFDLFLALQLKPMVEGLGTDSDFAGLDVTVLDDLVSGSAHSSEALEYILPIRAVRQFTAADITNQDLINQSIVLVNGVRIALNLQRVE
jgi:hypothetical protein